MYTLIYVLSFYDLEVQKRRPNDVDIINYQEKKEVWVAGLQKGRERNSGARARELRGEISKVSFPSPHATEKSLSLSKDFHAGQRKDSKRLGLLSARVIARKLCKHVKLEYIREVDVPGKWRRHNQVTQIQKLLFHSLL